MLTPRTVALIAARTTSSTFIEAFGGGNGAAWPARWTTSTTGAGGTIDIQSASGRMLTAATTFHTDRAILAASSWNQADSEVYTFLQLQTGAGQANIALRASGTWAAADPDTPDTGYKLLVDAAGGQFGLFKRLAATTTQIGTFQAFTYTVGAIYAVRFRVHGTALKVKIWDSVSGEPGSWTYEQTDSSITAAGQLQLSYTTTGADAREARWVGLSLTSNLDPTGTVGRTLGNVTAAASGSQSPGGTLARTLANVTSGTVTPWATAWAAAYTAQAAAGGQAHVVCVGDSVTQGFYATDPYYLNGWAGRVRTELNAHTGVASGTGLIPLYEEPQLVDARTSRAGSWATSVAAASLYSILEYTSSGGTYTIGPITCSAFRVIYLKDPVDGGAWTTTVDGGTPVAQTSLGTRGVYVLDIAAGSAGTHTLVLTATGNMFVSCIEAISNPTVGVKLSELGRTSQKISDLTADPNAFSSRQTLLNLDPDLAIVEFGLNDAFQGVSTATFQTNLEALIVDLKSLGASVAIVIAPPPNPATVPNWASFQTVMLNVAAAKNCGVIDMTAAWVSYAASSALYFDNVHPNNAGHASMATTVADYIEAASVPAGSAGTVGAAGTIARTLANAVVAASGGSTTTGTVARTLQPAVIQATGGQGVIGTIARTLGNVTLVAAGAFGGGAGTTGTVARTLDPVETASPLTDGLGAPILDGAGFAILDENGLPVLDESGNPLLDTAGEPIYVPGAEGAVGLGGGSLAVTLANVVATASGSTGGGTGSLAKTLGNVTSAASGTQGVPGSLAVTLGNATVAAAGTVGATGSLARTLGNVTSAASGTSTPTGVAGNLAVTLAAVIAASGGSSTAGEIAETLDALTAAAAGTAGVATVTGTVAETLADLISTSDGSLTTIGTVNRTLAMLVADSFGSSVTGSLAVTLANVRATTGGSGSYVDFQSVTIRERGFMVTIREMN